MHRSRLVGLLPSARVLTLTSLAVPFLPGGRPSEACILVVAFGALGLFPTYFAA